MLQKITFVKAVGLSNRIFLLFFLLFSTATQCMKRNDSKNIETNELKTIQQLQSEKILLSSQLSCRWIFCLPQVHIDIAICKYPKKEFRYTEFNHKNKKYICTTTPMSESIENLKNNMNNLKNNRYNGYSALGAATIAQDVSPEEKRTFIQKLLDAGFEPTQKDRELALVEKYERCTLLRQKIYMLYYILKIQRIPRELRDLMAQLTFETEESLF
ncbi:MAG TPA: hypothetical protein VKR54_04750 [Candidatus Babeliales bacterium]|jgi:hypothetical protein|nr:hypothetical protein [Candidatus Babeliales bacterium]